MPNSAVGTLPNRMVMRLVESGAVTAIDSVECQSGQHLEVPRITRGQSDAKSTAAQEFLMKMPEFYLVLRNRELDEELENSVFEAGFDDSELTVRNDRAAIWICHRQGELTTLVREALAQAQAAAIDVHHVEIENEVFA
jgi:hypothetical protein